MINKKLIRITIVAMFIFFNIVILNFGNANQDIKLILDDVDITNLSKPVLRDSRTLVPVRFISESLGAEVKWNGDNQTVYIQKGEKNVLLRIGSRLIEYNNGENYNISDTPIEIINEKTYIPIRLVSNALGVGIKWEENSRSVIISSKEESKISSFYDFDIINIANGDEINSEIVVNVDFDPKYNDKVNNIKLLLLDKDSAKGFIVSRNKDLNKQLKYLPKVKENGNKILVAGIYDEDNQLIAGKALNVNINVIPKVKLNGIENNQLVDDNIKIKPQVNFQPAYVDYIIQDSNAVEIKKISKRDPFETYTLKTSELKNGKYLVKLKAYDENGKDYSSNSYLINVNIENKLKLGGVRQGMKIRKFVNLIAIRNFDVKSTKFFIKDPNTGVERILKTIPYGSYEWRPESSDNGVKYLKVQVKDTSGKIYNSDYVKVNIDTSPYIELKGIGPKQVLTSEADLEINSNVEVDKIKYILTNLNNNSEKYLNADEKSGSYKLSVLDENSGDYSIKVTGNHNGKLISSESINFKIYKGELYHSRPIIEKDKFLDFASNLARESYMKTDMSAALQTAQAILETGWGQSVPVDKYSNNFSYNLFGIKGSATNGSVICNTWEVYNGKYYRVDDYFRAYNSSLESWKDHKSLLLKASRYQIFRNVMYDSSLGAWSIRRAGYATDPNYPVKLIRIINQYNLKELDKIGI